MKKIVSLLILTVSSLILQGCFWGLFGGYVKVQNETDSGISVDISGTDNNDSYNLINDRHIDSGDHETFPLGSWTFAPRVYAEYHGVTKKYKTSLNFFGWDTVHVNQKDFMPNVNN